MIKQIKTGLIIAHFEKHKSHIDIPSPETEQTFKRKERASEKQQQKETTFQRKNALNVEK